MYLEIEYFWQMNKTYKNVIDVFPRTREKAVDMFPQTKGGNSATMTYFLSCRAMWRVWHVYKGWICRNP